MATTRTVGMRVDNRKDFVLLLLQAEGEAPIAGVTRLQKYLFLLQEQYGWMTRVTTGEPYHFKAYDYGPFDSQLYDDLELLENVGLIASSPTDEPESRAEEGELEFLAFESGTSDPEVAPTTSEDVVRQYRLTSKGREFAQNLDLDEKGREQVEALKKEWNDRPLTSLLKSVYSQYPSFAAATKLPHLRSRSK
jgi:uncharacterized protein YwgA